MRCKYITACYSGFISEAHCAYVADEDTGLCPRHAAIQAAGAFDVMDSPSSTCVVVWEGFEAKQ